MRRKLQKFILDISRSVLKVDANVVNHLVNYDIFEKNTFQFLPVNMISEEIKNILISKERQNYFKNGNYYYFKTSMEICIIVVPLLDIEELDFKYFILGPFLPENFTVNMLDNLLEKYSNVSNDTAALRAFYTTIATAWESRVEGVAISVIQYFCDREDPQKIEEEITLSMNFMKNTQPTESFRVATEVLETRYKGENKVLEAIKRGDEKTALEMSKNWSGKNILPRVKDQLRSGKNLLLSGNTLFRKVVESSNVHPFYLDEISRKYALHIEKCTSMNQLDSVQEEMIRSYCKMVRKYSLSRYSKSVREAINYINLNITQDLTLDTVAKKLDLAPAYLSGQFKKETGQTITEFIHCKRCDHAAELLIHSNLSIAEIATQSGITDTSYFSMLFRKKYGMSPTHYRKMNKD